MPFWRFSVEALSILEITKIRCSTIIFLLIFCGLTQFMLFSSGWMSFVRNERIWLVPIICNFATSNFVFLQVFCWGGLDGLGKCIISSITLYYVVLRTKIDCYAFVHFRRMLSSNFCSSKCHVMFLFWVQLFLPSFCRLMWLSINYSRAYKTLVSVNCVKERDLINNII